MNNLRNDDILKYATENGIINIDDVLEAIMKKEREEIINSHPYRIWFAEKEQTWKTYVLDSTKKNNRRQVSRKDYDELVKVIVDEYKSNKKKEEEKYDIETLYKEWLSHALECKDIVKGTVDRYNNDWDRFFAGTEFSQRDIRYVTHMEVVKFVKSTVCGREEGDKITRKCYSNIKSLITGVFTYATTEKELRCIPIHMTLKDIKIPSKQFKKVVKKDSEQVFSDEEALMISDYIINNAKSTRDLGVLFALLTGIRVGELCTLKTTDQEKYKLWIRRTEVKEKDENGKTVLKVREFPKTESSMDFVELSESAYTVLSTIKKFNLQNGVQSDYLFWDHERNQRINSRAFDKKIRRICDKVGIPRRSMHKLRMTYASILFANGVEEKITQHQLRHKDSRITHQYYEFLVRSRGYKREQLNQADIFNINSVIAVNE